jgi:hypothetical protein
MPSHRAGVSSQVPRVNQVRFITAEDFADDCPVPFGLAMQLTRAELYALPDLLGDIPEATRADLAVWLYGRSHTRETGAKVAATFEGSSPRRAAGLAGN